MKKRATKKLRYLKNKSVWPFIIRFFLLMCFGAILVFALVSTILNSVIGNKMHDSIRNSYQVRQYIEEQIENGENPYVVVNKVKKMANAPLAVNVYDSEGSLLAYYGGKVGEELKNTDITSPNVEVRFTDKIEFYNRDAYVVTVDAITLVKNLATNLVHDVEEGRLSNIYMNQIYQYDYWMSTKTFDTNQIITDGFNGPVNVYVDDSNALNLDIFAVGANDNDDDRTVAVNINSSKSKYTIYMKYDQKVYLSDCVIIVPIAFLASLIFFIMIVVQLANAMSNIAYQRSILKMLLEDPITEGKSMLAFEQFAEKNLVLGMKRGYAVVDLSLMRYQNYCTMYGIEEGERLLMALDRAIANNLVRGEMVAKVSNSDFIILLCTKKNDKVENILRERMTRILERVPDELRTTKRRVEPLHGLANIGLKAGMYVLNPALDKEAKKKRRDRSRNIEQLHMKAGIAKQALGDEAGLMVYNHKMWEDELWAQKVEDMMQDALDASEFQVYIQPKYHPSTEQLMGGEALVRWISPTEGFISPGQFIPIFEKNGFITKLDDYMLAHTAELQAKWLAEGKKIVPISVNVSRLHFSKPDLAEHIKKIVDQYNLPHEYIEIELTESAFFDDKKALLSTVRRLQEYGFEVSMDDFGAGYSSLNSLKDLPLNVLKLDAEFFRGESIDSRGEIVVSEAIALAKQLNMKIVAEGIEKKEQVEFLAKQDCDMIQGYYFAKPMPANEYEGRMSNRDEATGETKEEVKEEDIEETTVEETTIEETTAKEVEEDNREIRSIIEETVLAEGAAGNGCDLDN